jgi:hypothetical protein
MPRPQRERKAPERFTFSPNHKVLDDYKAEQHSSESEESSPVDDVSDVTSDSDFDSIAVDQEDSSASLGSDEAVSDNDSPDDSDPESDVLNSSDFEGVDSEEEADAAEESLSADLCEPEPPKKKRASPKKASPAKRQKK